MPVDVILGLQWGDEGKGKIIDYMASNSDYVVRFQGGPNAGHTIYRNEKEIVLHQIPSGVLSPSTKGIIAHGMVIDLHILHEEILKIKSHVPDIMERLYISHNTHLILKYHKLLDVLSETKKPNAIGTTKRGVGASYADKILRKGLCMHDLTNEKILYNKIEERLSYYNPIFIHHFNSNSLDAKEIAESILEYSSFFKPMLCDSISMLNNAIALNKNILLEGAQGSLLDIDMGIYPYVTSSSTITAGACAGTGISPKKLNRVIGVTKSYATRVGEGPFPTEGDESLSQLLRAQGNEYGATTGRPRRCGWLDLVALKYAIQINGITELVLTKLDVLDGLDKIKICTAYKIKNEIVTEFSATLKKITHVEPIYETVPGWQSSTADMQSMEKMPLRAKKFISIIEKYLDTKISMISTGPKKDAIIVVQ